jgi:hypothetical protein
MPPLRRALVAASLLLASIVCYRLLPSSGADVQTNGMGVRGKARATAAAATAAAAAKTTTTTTMTATASAGSRSTHTTAAVATSGSAGPPCSVGGPSAVADVGNAAPMRQVPEWLAPAGARAGRPEGAGRVYLYLVEQRRVLLLHCGNAFHDVGNFTSRGEWHRGGGAGNTLTLHFWSARAAAGAARAHAPLLLEFAAVGEGAQFGGSWVGLGGGATLRLATPQEVRRAGHRPPTARGACRPGFLPSLQADKARWRGCDDGTRTYEPATCAMRRFTAREARQCLAGQSLLLAGDSLTRYQYMSLAYFLKNGAYPDRTSRDDGRHGKNVCIEGSYRGGPHDAWQTFYIESTAQLSTNGTPGAERCDCFRELQWNTSRLFENRFYRDDENDISLTFLHAINAPMHGHHSAAAPTVEAYSYRPPDWQGDLADALESVVPRLVPKVDVLIWNSGVFRTYLPTDDALLRRIMRAGKRVAKRAFWKGTTTYHGGGDQQDECSIDQKDLTAKRIAIEEGWDIYDLSPATHMFSEPGFHWKWPGPADNFTGVYWDAVHFLPYMYEEFNTMLLNEICP